MNTIGKVAIVISVIAFLAFYNWLPDMCGNDIYSETLSPNGELKAVIFQRDCGATTGFSTQVSILDTDETLENDGGNIFRMDGHPNDAAPIISWESDSALTIKKTVNNKEYFAESTYGWFNPIQIRYSGS